MYKVPQIERRKIGSVVIIDLKGEIVGPWAVRAKESLESLISQLPKQQILINLKEVTSIDSLGVKAILENFPKKTRSAIVCGRIAVMEMFSLIADMKQIKVFKNEDDVVEYFGKDFVADNGLVLYEEQRRHPRLRTALPLEFWYADEKGENVTFTAIVTDLSQGGLFAEYLDVESMADFNRMFKPQDLNELNLKLKLPGEQHVFVHGVVTRTIIAKEQVGVGVKFNDLSSVDKKKIESFLRS